MTFNVDHILNEWPIDDDHADTTGNNHCDIRALRMPCDWSRATADIHELGDEIKRQEVSVGFLSDSLGKAIAQMALRDSEIERLQRWQTEATEVLGCWEDKVYGLIDAKNEYVGLSKYRVVADEIKTMRATIDAAYMEGPHDNADTPQRPPAESEQPT